MRIKELREEKNLSQTKLAEIIQTSQRNIGRWENNENEPSYTQLVKLADFFGCSIDYLVGRDDDYSAPTFYTSSEEQELIKAYRQLSFDQQQVIKVQLGALVEVNK